MSGVETLIFLIMVTVISFSGVAMPGPVFAATVEKSYHDRWAGFWVSIGHVIAEAPVILIIYFGLRRLFEYKLLMNIISIAGGVVLVWMGISMFLMRAEINENISAIPISATATGVVTTATNPLYYAWWATVGAALISRVAPHGTGVFVLFLIFHWLADVLWLSIVSISVYNTRHLWTSRAKVWVFSVCSFLLAGFGLFFLVHPFV